MANPTITRDSDSVIFTFQDGDCDTVTSAKNGQVDVSPLPGSDSDSAFGIDINGVTRTFTLSGVLTPATSTRTSSGTTTTVQQQLDWLETLLNGTQTGHTLNTTFYSSKNVFVQSINMQESSGDSGILDFTITFIEAS